VTNHTSADFVISPPEALQIATRVQHALTSKTAPPARNGKREDSQMVLSGGPHLPIFVFPQVPQTMTTATEMKGIADLNHLFLHSINIP
jgi:hypothetical protein